MTGYLGGLLILAAAAIGGAVAALAPLHHVLT